MKHVIKTVRGLAKNFISSIRTKSVRQNAVYNWNY